MAIYGYGTCQNRGCYEDCEGVSNYCSKKCERADAKKIALDKRVLKEEKAKVKRKMFPWHGEPPICNKPGCGQPCKWRSSFWTTYCSKECSFTHRAFDRGVK